jgi:hypothetical protein
MRCSPVKKGWQLLHTSVCSRSRVERVLNVLPQEHTTVASTYCGWMFAFTGPGFLSARIDRERIAVDGHNGLTRSL